MLIHFIFFPGNTHLGIEILQTKQDLCAIHNTSNVRILGNFDSGVCEGPREMMGKLLLDNLFQL